ncbi:uncharacterized protein LOC129755805 [Uranotaenia lowii]|uniref:uncharacterized protein LOC129755805 n=1 Tax=Uranotaenia lowii TaxID=190385 RepID=UPI002478636D|nr:uncharacterized protein LOC129755805 [Uranotaenia lowii]
MIRTAIVLVCCLIGLVACKNPRGLLWEGFAQQCLKKTGSNDTFFTVMQNYQVSVGECYKTEVNLDNLNTDIENFDSSISARKAVFRRTCPLYLNAVRCLDLVTIEARKCLESKEQELLESLRNAIPEAVKLICKNDGEIFFSSEDAPRSCTEDIGYFLRECEERITDPSAFLHISTFSQNNCDDLTAYRSCFAAKLEGCKGHRWLEVFDLLYNPIIKATPCKV